MKKPLQTCALVALSAASAHAATIITETGVRTRSGNGATGTGDGQIGSNGNDNNTNGGPAGSPDIGSTWRGSVRFSINDILNADGGDAYTTAADLNNLTIAVTLTVANVGSNNPVGYAPLFTTSGPLADGGISGFLAGLSSGTAATYTDNGAAGLDAGDTYTFTVSGVDLSSGAGSDNFVVGFIGNQNAPANSLIQFLNNDNNTISVSTVPEPSSTALLGLAGLGLLIRRRR